MLQNLTTSLRSPRRFSTLSGGLADEGYPAPSEEVRLAWATHLAVRSAFSAILVDRPGLGEADRADLIRRRAPLARYAVHLNRSVV